MSTNFVKICRVNPVTPELRKYEEAIRKLNSLQTNTSVLEEAKRGLEKGFNRSRNVSETVKYLKRVDVDIERFDGKVIHISGTKGKGSTAILTEALLRSVPYKTGLFTSPHLTSVRERIAINGVPLSLATFVNYFWEVYNRLHQLKENENDMPSYFKFLTVLALKVFLSEEVDVAVVEVGIGGELDCTNGFRKTPIVGITSIGLDHTSILGKTVEEIAWQKAGIIKSGSRVFTIPNLKESVLEVMKSRALEKKCHLEIVPELSKYSWDTSDLTIPQKLNTSLALQLAKAWEVWHNNGKHKEYDPLNVTDREIKAVSECQIPGRCHRIYSKELNATFYLDGAHTIESLEVAKAWFLESAASENQKKVLIFNLTGERARQPLLNVLIDCKFSEAVFCTNNVSSKMDELPADFIKSAVSLDKAYSKAQENLRAWSELCAGQVPARAVLTVSEALSSVCTPGCQPPPLVLVTGSMHLVGAAVSLLQT